MQRNHKILSINCNCTSGGGKGMLEVAEISRMYSFEYFTVSPYSKKVNLDNHFNITKRWQKFLNRNISQLIGDDNIVPFAETKKLITLINTIKPDLIHLRGLHGWYIDYIELINHIKKLNIPVVWTQHDCWAFTGKCTYFDKVQCYKWIKSCGNCPLLKEYPKSIVFDKTKMMFERKKSVFTKLNNCNIVAVSKWLEDILHKSIFCNYNILTIENGIDTNIFKPTQSSVLQDNNLDGKHIILGVAASWSERKGLYDFLELKKQIKDENIEFVIIGANQEVMKLCQGVGIHAFERISDKVDLAKWLTACHVFFNPSVEETFGRVTAEAMACGAPIVAYNSAATPELLRDTDNYCVEAHNLLEVEKSIKLILLNGKDFYEKTNINKARINYDMKKQFTKYVDLYNSMLK